MPAFTGYNPYNTRTSTQQGLQHQLLERLALQSGIGTQGLAQVATQNANSVNQQSAQDLAEQALKTEVSRARQFEAAEIGESIFGNTESSNLKGKSAATEAIEKAAMDVLEERDEAILADPEAGIPGRSRWKEMSKQEKFSTIMQVLGNALAVAASSDPGAAVQRQISQMIAERQELADRRERATENAAGREFQRGQLETAKEAEAAAQEREYSFRTEQREDQQSFELEQDIEKFKREIDFATLKMQHQSDEAEKDRDLRRDLTASEIRERRRVDKARTSQMLISELGTSILSTGENEFGTVDGTARAQRLADCFDDIGSCSDSDQAVLHRALMERDGVDPQTAIRKQALKLVGKPMPVPIRDPETGEVVKDPNTGAPQFVTDDFGKPLTVPMSMEEALVQVTYRLEDTEAARTRIVEDPKIEEQKKISGVLARVNPSRVEPSHLYGSGGSPGLVDLLKARYDASTPEELSKAFDQFEKEQIARGKDPFKDEIRKTFEQEVVNEEVRVMNDNIFQLYGIRNPTSTQRLVISRYEASGLPPEEIKKLLNISSRN